MIGRLVTKFAYFWRNSTYNFIGQNLISSWMMSWIILWSFARYFNRFDWLNWIGRSFLLIGQKISNRSAVRKKPYRAWRMLAFAPGRGGISTKFDRVVVIFKTGSTAFCVFMECTHLGQAVKVGSQLIEKIRREKATQWTCSSTLWNKRGDKRPFPLILVFWFLSTAGILLHATNPVLFSLI